MRVESQCLSQYEIVINDFAPNLWKRSPYGVVSLIDVLRFYAQSFVSATSTVMQVGQMLRRGEGLGDAQLKPLAESFGELMRECQKLDLPMTLRQLQTIKKSIDDGTFRSYADIYQQLAELMSRLWDELDINLFYQIESSKKAYADAGWLAESLLAYQFPEVWKELQAAGRLYAYGEGTGCVFHLMRVVDWGLKRVADSLGISYDNRNWQGIADALTKKMEQKYKDKSKDWRSAEPFYAGILTDIQAVSRAHRNQVLHELEKKYQDKEAFYMLTVVEAFALHTVEQTEKRKRGDVISFLLSLFS